MSATLAAPAPTAEQAVAEYDARRAERTRRLAAIAKFTHLRVQANILLLEAARVERLPDLLRAQALASAGIAGHRFHRVYGEATADDAGALIDDLKAVWAMVDPLVEAVGQEAAGAFSGVDTALFHDQLRGALEGNATHAIESAADVESEDAPSIDVNEEHRTHGGRV
jgi:hypothetical protein